MNRINVSAVSWAWLLPRRGRSGRRLDFYGKHHAPDGAARVKLNLFKLYRVVKEEGVANLIEDERSLVAAISSGKCVVDELLHPPKVGRKMCEINIKVGRKTCFCE